MLGIMVYGHYVGLLTGEVSRMKNFNSSFRRFVNNTADFQADSVASLEEVTRGLDLNSEIIDFPRRQPLRIGVSMNW